MRSDTAIATGAPRVRLVITLSVAGAVTVMLGAILLVVGLAMRVVSRHAAGQVTVLGLGMAVAGTAFGLVILLVFALAWAFAAARPLPSGTRDSGTRRRGGQVLSPTGGYSPGGLLGAPRDARRQPPAAAADRPSWPAPPMPPRERMSSPAAAAWRQAAPPPPAAVLRRGVPPQETVWLRGATPPSGAVPAHGPVPRHGDGWPSDAMPPAATVRPPATAPRKPPAAPAVEAPAQVFVYRDTGGEPDEVALEPQAAPSGDSDTAYWYAPLQEATDPARDEHRRENEAPAPQTRGPFEPLVSSAAESAAEEKRDDAARDRERKLEQLKDLYLTAEAIGEENVDKHFDKLLAQQRALISDYFKRSAAGQAGADVAAEKPRA